MSDGSSIEGIFCEAPSDNEGKEPYTKNKSDRWKLVQKLTKNLQEEK